jgi:chromosome partitioning protein
MLRLAKEARISSISREIDREHALAMSHYERTEPTDSVGQSPKKGAKNMATVLSMINMKGGVGKTTLAMQLAHAADNLDLRTLAVDLDPQSNLSQALMGPAYIDHLAEEKPTVVDILENHVQARSTGRSSRLLDIQDVVVKKAGYWRHSTLDLIPSHLELARAARYLPGHERRLARALARVRDEYDLVIIDCAPTESVLTDAAYFASRFLLVPIKPEFMATIGLPLLARSLREFQIESDGHEIEIAGLVFNHSSSYSAGPEGQQSIRDVTQIATEQGWHICENQVRYSASYAKSAREHTPLSRTSYARNEVVEGFRRLADEVFELIGAANLPRPTRTNVSGDVGEDYEELVPPP